MRFFIALEIPNENRLQFKPIQEKLNTLIPQIKLTDLEKIHLTLAFIGDQPEEFKGALIKVLEKSVRGISSFEITPAYIDGFPNIHHPLVLWIGVKGDIDKVLQIRERVKDGFSALDLAADERRFIPHITIAKLNGNFKVDRELEVEFEKIMTLDFDPIKITSIKLFESVSEGGLHKHNTLAEVKLDP